MLQATKIIQRNSKKRKHKIIGTVIKVGGRTVGQVIGDTFVKDITNRHMLTTPPAIANNIQALHDAERAGAVYCEFTNTDTGIIYRAAIAKIFWDMGKPFNFGWGDQIMLTLSNWTQTRSAEYSSTDTDAQEYSEADSTHGEVKPLNIKSRAPKGVTFTPGKQLTLWGRK
jgi:hypothetical protein